MEEWRQAIGNYQVSNLGNVMSPHGRVLRPYCNKGYMTLAIRIGKSRSMVQVHRLVAMAFIPNPENKPNINHKDNNPGNNTVQNLEWCTQKENVDHAIRIGVYKKRGEDNQSTKLTSAEVLEIRELIVAGRDNYSIAEMYGITYQNVHAIKIRKSWKHI
jgi:hypothetical protein